MPLSRDQLKILQHEASQRVEEVVSLAQRICAVAAPTGEERQRAEFVASLWQERGYVPEIDTLSNVFVGRPGVDKQANLPALMLLSHLDTVFPANVPLHICRDGDLVYGPGIGDNCVSVAAVLVLFEMLDRLGWHTPRDLIAVANVGEEGLGNLRGARAAVERYRARLGAVLAVDGRLGSIVNAAVGSQRLRIVVTGPGGHAYGSFGTPSAIHGLAKIVAALADLSVPEQPKTTFNVGMIEGGTSINTVASRASALLDLRSVDVDALQRLTEQARAVIRNHLEPGLQVSIEVLGERPAGNCPETSFLVQHAIEALRWLEIEPRLEASSTDANIPISLGIPAVCVGITRGDKAHTINEFILVSPISKGLAQVLRLLLEV